MGFFTKYNKKKFTVNTEGFEYKSLQDLLEESGGEAEYPIRAIYINRKSVFGDAPVIATDNYFVNIPAHMLSACEDILENEEAVQLINEGKAGFKISTYTASNYGNKTCYTIEFIDW